MAAAGVARAAVLTVGAVVHLQPPLDQVAGEAGQEIPPVVSPEGPAVQAGTAS